MIFIENVNTFFGAVEKQFQEKMVFKCLDSSCNSGYSCTEANTGVAL